MDLACLTALIFQLCVCLEHLKSNVWWVFEREALAKEGTNLRSAYYRVGGISSGVKFMHSEEVRWQRRCTCIEDAIQAWPALLSVIESIEMQAGTLCIAAHEVVILVPDNDFLSDELTELEFITLFAVFSHTFNFEAHAFLVPPPHLLHTLHDHLVFTAMLL